jgi:hypothetical protein
VVPSVPAMRPELLERPPRDINFSMPHPNQKGQSAVEFVLIAPLLFFMFFGIIQIAYTAYVSFAVQRAAYSISREAAASDDPVTYNPYYQLAYCLAPLGQLNHVTLATILATKCEITADDDQVHVQIIYPMPIWVPLVGKIFGEKLNLNPIGMVPLGPTLQQVFQIIGKPIPDIAFNNLNLPFVHLMVFSADAVNENQTKPED